MTTRVNNWLLNIGILVTFGVAMVLVYAFFIRVTTEQPDPHRLDNPGNLLGTIIQVQVLNASGGNGLAREMMDYLRDQGFDVVEMGNAKEGILQKLESEGYEVEKVDGKLVYLEKSVIQDRIGNLDAAQQVALAVGMPVEEIIQDIKLEYFLDATIIIGKDFADLKPWKVELDPSELEAAESDSTN